MSGNVCHVKIICRNLTLENRAIKCAKRENVDIEALFVMGGHEANRQYGPTLTAFSAKLQCVLAENETRFGQKRG